LVQIKYLSPDWRHVIIAGTTGSLANTPAGKVSVESPITDGLFHIAEGAGIAVAGSETGVLIVIGAGIVGLGLSEVEAGIFDESFPANPVAGTSYEAEGTIVLPEITVYGELPSNVTPDNVLDLGTIEISDLPNMPPAGGDGGNGGNGGGP
jgi:hypothetical protein